MSDFLQAISYLVKIPSFVRRSYFQHLLSSELSHVSFVPKDLP